MYSRAISSVLFLLLVISTLFACAPNSPGTPIRPIQPTLPTDTPAPVPSDTATSSPRPMTTEQPTLPPTASPSRTGTVSTPTVAPVSPSPASAPTAISTAVTPTVSSGDPVIVAAGDIACDPASSLFKDGKGNATACHQMAVSDMVLRIKPAAVLTLGDFQYFCGSLAAANKSYDPSWGRFKSITFPVVGNHEYLTTADAGPSTACDASNAGAAGYFKYYGERAGTPGKGYYSFDIGAWHLIALNSNCSDAGGCNGGSPQETWLRADLAAHRAKCTLAFWHIPLWSSGGRANNNTATFAKDLYDANAELILTGHDHTFERFAPQDPGGKADPARGLREFVVGTGGANHTQFENIFPNSEIRNADTFGVLKLTLHPDSYNWAFLPEPGGSFTDSGNQACH